VHAGIAGRDRAAIARSAGVGKTAGCGARRLKLVLGFWQRRAQHRRAHDQLDAPDLGILGLPAGEHPFGIVGLDPALEKAGRYRQAHGSVFNCFQVHAREPARIDVVADLNAQALFDPGPTFLIIRVKHFLFS
jgi:hypothetical protein